MRFGGYPTKGIEDGNHGEDRARSDRDVGTQKSSGDRRENDVRFLSASSGRWWRSDLGPAVSRLCLDCRRLSAHGSPADHPAFGTDLGRGREDIVALAPLGVGGCERQRGVCGAVVRLRGVVREPGPYPLAGAETEGRTIAELETQLAYIDGRENVASSSSTCATPTSLLPSGSSRTPSSWPTSFTSSACSPRTSTGAGSSGSSHSVVGEMG
jgi:hypothetical protein